MIKKTKVHVTYFLIAIITFIALSCKKENNDYRTKYLGNFRFKIIQDCWSMEGYMPADTFFYNGIIRTYELGDSQNDMNSYEDDDKNLNEKITLEFMDNKIITSIIDEDGIFLQVNPNPHYNQYGKFLNIDSIEFLINKSAQGGGCTYEVTAIRN